MIDCFIIHSMGRNIMQDVRLDLSLYCKTAQVLIPRVFTLGDRLPNSPTYGCFDRLYWHYQELDFANGRLQEVAWLLALLYSQEFPDGKYYKNTQVQAWALAAIQFWASIQRPDGSLDEVYPFEHSFVSTAFSTFAITEALLLLNNEDYNKVIIQSGRWLASHENMRVANQMAGACAALYNIYLLTGDAFFQEAAKKKLQRLSTLQHQDGYFMEYGGYDMGYLSIGLSYLSRYFEKSMDEQAYQMIQKAIRFATPKVFENGTYDYNVTSRHTQYIYPYGFLQDPEKTVLTRHLNGLTQDCVVSPIWMDDRFFIPLTIDYLTSYLRGNTLCA